MRPCRAVAHACLACLAWLAISAAFASGVQTLESARFLPGADPGAAHAVSQPVTLPHPVVFTAPDLKGDAWYLLDWNLPTAPQSPQAIYVTATTVPLQVYVNGTLIGSTGPLDGRRPRSYEQSPLFAVPLDDLQAGTNVVSLHVRMRSAQGSGIGKLLVGDTVVLQRHAGRDLVAHTFGPAAVSVATFSMGLFILVLWIRRRDPAHGLFGFAAILWSAHTLVSLLPETPLPQPHWYIVWHGAYVVFVALLCLFCLRFTGVRWPTYRRVVLVYTALVVPLLYAANSAGRLGDAASYARLGALVLVFFALAAVARYAWQKWNAESALLLIAGVVSACFAVHDWVLSQDESTIRPLWLVPYAALTFLMLVGYILADRFVRAVTETERLNAELEQRVIEKSSQLTQQLAATQSARLTAERAKEAAETANLAKTRFLAAASHDLRQPLHALGMFSQALEQHLNDDRGRAVLQRIRNSVDALEALFSALLDISKLDAGAVMSRPADFHVRPLLERIVAEGAPDAIERGLKLSLVCPDAIVRSDPVLLERIVRNLLANALRYTQKGGVVVGCRRRGAAYSIEVWDSGPGIPADQRERIFEEFYQIGNSGRDRSLGLGLGLAIVRRVAALLGHDVDLTSTVGRGSVFRLIVPAGDAQAVAAGSREALPSGDPLTGRRILVLDDELDVREATVNVLKGWGCDAIGAASLAAAREAIGTHGIPDAVVLDYRLRDSADGLTALMRLEAELGVTLPAVMVSGESAPDRLARIQASGVPLLHKPASPARLRSLLSHVLNGTRVTAASGA